VSAYRVGVTGGLASGKSTVARWLAAAGFPVVDADQVVADLYRPGQPGAAAVAALFGPAMLDAAGGVDKKRLSARIFPPGAGGADEPARHALEAAIHPLVQQRYQEISAAARGVVVFEATLMVESGSARGFDLVVTVEADPEVRLQRAVARGMPEPAARARLAAQGDGAARRAGAHRVLDNDGDLAALRRQVDPLIAELGTHAEDRP
jgi:dephospho-CoA kinase